MSKDDTVKVLNTGTRAENAGKLAIKPGLNSVDAKAWADAKARPSVGAMLAAGVFVLAA